jgi:DNA end-binding protein Ku
MARSIWSGAVSFGLVNVPVRAVSAVRDHDVHFHQIDKRTGARIRHKKVSERSGREIADERIVMGFELEPGRYVSFDPDELAELRPESSKSVDLDCFVPLADVDPIYFERTYWLVPDGDGANKPYRLLAAAMEDRGLVGIGTVVMRTKQYLTAIRPIDGALAMSTMRFGDEVVPRRDVEGLPDRRTKPDSKMLQMATRLIDELSDEWKPERYHDTYTEELRKRIRAKESGEEIVAAEEPAPASNVTDLTEALQASLDSARRPRRRSRKAS